MCRSTTDTLTTQCHNINQFGLYRETHYYTVRPPVVHYLKIGV